MRDRSVHFPVFNTHIIDRNHRLIDHKKRVLFVAIVCIGRLLTIAGSISLAYFYETLFFPQTL